MGTSRCTRPETSAAARGRGQHRACSSLLTCAFLFGAVPALAQPTADAIATPSWAGRGPFTRAERALGPFTIGAESFSVVLRLLRAPDAAEALDEETVESFSIVDARGQEHYAHSFEAEASEGRFAETVGISAFALESAGRRLFQFRQGALEELSVGAGETVGLVLYYGYLPSAPNSGLSCQIFTMEGGLLTPRFAPITVYGSIHDLLPGRRDTARRLCAGNTIRFGVWTGWFEVTVPLQVLDELRIVPLHHHLTYGLDAFAVVVQRTPPGEDTFVRLHRFPGDRVPRHVVVRPNSAVDFAWAYAGVVFEPGVLENALRVRDMPWLKVTIDGKEGFIRAAEDLAALGLSPAG